MSYTADVQITSKSGMHARPAANLARLAKGLESTVTLRTDGNVVNATSVLALITARIAEGQTVTVECDGATAENDLAVIVAAIQSGLGD